ncbi:MAG: hypothetical protein GY760_01305 [Deltaproteobacteria bacterium]|nr:hypothetical protein [Deltaproteobacteria bacterium]
MKRLNYCFIGMMGILIVLTTPFTITAAKIFWMVQDWPPCIYMENGEVKSYDGEMIKMIQAELPEYNHSFITGNLIIKILDEIQGISKNNEPILLQFFLEITMYFVKREVIRDSLQLTLPGKKNFSKIKKMFVFLDILKNLEEKKLYISAYLQPISFQM